MEDDRTYLPGQVIARLLRAAPGELLQPSLDV